MCVFNSRHGIVLYSHPFTYQVYVTVQFTVWSGTCSVSVVTEALFYYSIKIKSYAEGNTSMQNQLAPTTNSDVLYVLYTHTYV